MSSTSPGIVRAPTRAKLPCHSNIVRPPSVPRALGVLKPGVLLDEGQMDRPDRAVAGLRQDDLGLPLDLSPVLGLRVAREVAFLAVDER